MGHRKRHQINKSAQQESAIERRYSVDGLQTRAAENGGVTLRGYALRFGVAYNMGWFDEEVAPGALDGADMSDVRVLFNHDANIILGRTAAQTARVGIDKEGMWYEVDLPNSPNGENAREAVDRGDVTQSSWGFSLVRDEAGKSIGDKWEVRNGRKYRTLTAIDVVYDASPVVYPANPDTSIATRSARMAGMEVRDEDMEEAPIDGEVTPGVQPGEPADKWDLAWMIDTLTWASTTTNESVASLNSRIDQYKRYSGANLQESAIFNDLITACTTAKQAMITLLDRHLDAAKTLNGSENRAANSVIEHEKNEAAPETDTIQKELDKECDVHEMRLKMLSKRFNDN